MSYSYDPKAQLRIKWEYDPDPDMSWLDQFDTEEAYAGNEVMCHETGKPLSFEKYQRTYGDPNRHVMMVALVEVYADGKWEVIDSLCSIDFLDWDPPTSDEWAEDNLDSIGNTYQRDQSREMIDQARKTLEVDHEEARAFFYQEALTVQSACNLSGVVHAFSRAMKWICNEANLQEQGTDWKNQHPISRLFAEQIFFLASGRDRDASYHEAYRQVERVLKAIATKTCPNDDRPPASPSSNLCGPCLMGRSQ